MIEKFISISFVSLGWIVTTLMSFGCSLKLATYPKGSTQQVFDSIFRKLSSSSNEIYVATHWVSEPKCTKERFGVSSFSGYEEDIIFYTNLPENDVKSMFQSTLVSDNWQRIDDYLCKEMTNQTYCAFSYYHKDFLDGFSDGEQPMKDKYNNSFIVYIYRR